MARHCLEAEAAASFQAEEAEEAEEVVEVVEEALLDEFVWFDIMVSLFSYLWCAFGFVCCVFHFGFCGNLLSQGQWVSTMYVLYRSLSMVSTNSFSKQIMVMLAAPF